MKGSVFDCPANRKSQRGPELWDETNSRFDRWDSKMSAMMDVAASKGKEVSDAVRIAWRTLMSMTKIKFQWLNRSPWTVWRLRENRSIAQVWLAENNADGLAAGGNRETASKRAHRIVAHFCTGELGKQLAAFAVGGEILEGSILDHELKAYETAFIDGLAVEGVHRDVNVVCSRASSSTFPFWAAEIRLRQNIDLYNSEVDAGRGSSFHDRLTNYKCVLQSRNLSLHGGMAAPVKLPLSDFLARVYRLFPYNLHDWSDFVSQSVGPSDNVEKRGDGEHRVETFSHSIVWPV